MRLFQQNWRKYDTVVADAMDRTALLRENEKLRRKNLLLREERELLKNDPKCSTPVRHKNRSCLSRRTRG